MRTVLRLLILPLVLLLTACGSGSPDPTDPHAEVSGGWVGGEPDWEDGNSAADPMAAAEGDFATGSEPPVDADGARKKRPGGDLRAGSVDDNADYAAYLDYLKRIGKLGLDLRPFDPRGRVLVTVVGANGLPVAGEEVAVTASGGDVVTLRTTADGTVRFLPALYDQPIDGTFGFEADAVSAEADGGGEARLEVSKDGGATGAVPLDILFLLDATGSMGDEIDQLKKQIDTVAQRVAGLDGNPDVRFAMTLYRDQGDSFLTSTYDFTSHVEEFRKALSKVKAGGGGDYPEALEEGLAEALAKPSWRDPADAVQLVFLVADAPPQTTRTVQKTYPDSIRDAVERGIKIFPVASSESDDLAEAVFRQLAQATGARFVFLSYGAAGAATGEHTDIDSTDYEELSLDELIVRLTAEELAALTGQEDVVPTPDPTPDPTTPPGQ